MLSRLLKWLIHVISFGMFGKAVVLKRKAIVPLLIMPRLSDDIGLDQVAEVSGDSYYTSSPWAVDRRKIESAIRIADNWLSNVLGRRIRWERLISINSARSLSEWRERKISLIKDEVDRLKLPWARDYIYLGFVRGMGGYAGGIRYENDAAGYGMVGDICLEAICEYPEPTAGAVLLEQPPWPPVAYSRMGQIGAFVHEALHGLDLPHPDGWPEGDRPVSEETIMGNWWEMQSFEPTKGLTQPEIDRVIEWLDL